MFIPFIQIKYVTYLHLQNFMDDFSAENTQNIEINGKN